MRGDNVKSKNRSALILILAALLAFCVIMSLPIYNFTSNVYIKKSPNTFVGDETYQQVSAEVEAVAEEYRTQGHEVEVSEEITERTNSKGEKTSLITFTVSESFTKNGWAFLGAGLNFSYALWTALLSFVLSLLCALAGALSGMDTPYRDLDKRSKRLRSASAVFGLVALLAIPVFVMMTTYTVSRRVTLYSSGVATEGKELLYAKLNDFLFDGMAGDGLDNALKALSFRNNYLIWLGMLCAGAAMLGGVQLRHGAIKHTLMRGFLYAFVIALCVFILYPYYVMLITAFRSNAETTDMYFQHLFPTEWKFENLTYILGKGVPRYLLNSFFVAGGATLIALICGIPAAYALARMKFKGKNIFMGFVIMSQMFSPVVLLIGIAQLMNTLKLNDSVVGLMLINAAFNQAFAVWLLHGTFSAISSEMEQAARIDGCTVFGSLWRVLIPMAAPGIVTALIFVFINSWNEYTISTVLISTAANRPITVGITQFSSFNMIEWQYLFAASLLATIPVVILFMCIEKHLTAGLTSGGVKG